MIQAVVLTAIDMERFFEAASAWRAPNHESIKSHMDNGVEASPRHFQDKGRKGYAGSIPSRIVKNHIKVQSRRNVGHTTTFAHILRYKRVGRPYDFRTIPHRIFFA